MRQFNSDTRTTARGSGMICLMQLPSLLSTGRVYIEGVLTVHLRMLDLSSGFQERPKQDTQPDNNCPIVHLRLTKRTASLSSGLQAMATRTSGHFPLSLSTVPPKHSAPAPHTAPHTRTALRGLLHCSCPTAALPAPRAWPAQPTQRFSKADVLPRGSHSLASPEAGT